MSQLGTLIWLKWTLFRNALRSRKGIANRAASMLGTLAALGLALLVASGLGVFAYVSVRHNGEAWAMPALLVLFGILSFVYLTWITLPLNFGGGGAFDPGRLLLYPISLKKLFAIDLLSEFTSLASIFAVPVVFAISLGAGLASGNVALALVCAVSASVLGVALSKMVTALIGSMMQRKRTRGEALIALIGGVGGLAGGVLGPLFQRMSMENFARHVELPRGLRFTPPGAIAVALTEGLRPDGAQTLTLSLLIVAAYTLLVVIVCYRLALRIADAGGGKVKAKNVRVAKRVKEKDLSGGWEVPFLSPVLAAIVGKELRYLLRNPQVRTLLLMAPVFSVVFIYAYAGKGVAHGAATGFRLYAEGGLASFITLYVFMFVSGITSNIFGYDGAGMRALVLAPVERQTILIGKNIATMLLAFVMATAGLLLSEVLFSYLSFEAVCFAALCFIIFAVGFSLTGNWLSLRYPKRVEMGKRIARSGVAGLLVVVTFFLGAIVPAAAIAAAYFAKSLLLKYAILALCAGGGMMLYSILIKRQGRFLRERELEILEAITGRSDDDSRVLG